MDRREERRRASTSGRRPPAGSRDPDARSGDARPIARGSRRGSPSLDAAQADRERRRADQDAVSRQGQGRRVPARDARPARSYIRRASRPTSPTRSTTSTARCGGASAGSSGRSRSGTRSASARCSRPRPASTKRRRLPPLVADLLTRGRNRFRDGVAAAGGAGPADPEVREGSQRGRADETPARASSISATACWRSSSTRR